MSVGINSLLSSISVFSADLKKNSNSTQFNKGFWSCNGEALEPIKPLQPVGQAAEFKFESKFEPLPVIWQSLLKANPKLSSLDSLIITGFRLLSIISSQLEVVQQWKVLTTRSMTRHSFGRSYRLAPTLHIYELVAVAAGSYRLAWGWSATTFAILTWFESQTDVNAWWILGCDHWFYFQWSLLTLIALLNLSIIHWSLTSGYIGTNMHFQNWILSRADLDQLPVSFVWICPSSGCLLRFKSNSTATSDGYV